MSFSKRIKARFKDAVKFINDFENTASELAIDKGYKYVVCGHIHQPEMRTISLEKGSVIYLNSGDWVESLTALEYHNKAWSIYKYQPEQFTDPVIDHDDMLDSQDLNAMLDVNALFLQFTSRAI